MAPPKVTTPSANGNNENNADESLSTADVEVLDVVFKSLPKDAKPKAKWNEIAEQLGMKGGKYALQRFTRLAAKRGWFDAAGDSPAASGTESAKKVRSSAKRAAPKKQAAAEDNSEEGDGHDDENESPTKKAKTHEDPFVNFSSEA